MRGGIIGIRFPVSRLMVGMARRQYGFDHAITEGITAPLWQIRTLARQILQRPFRQRTSAQLERTAIGVAQTNQGT
ncbi:hypothetical protein D3C73_1592100 [compost metagenome]